jgi:hypothetical protein
MLRRVALVTTDVSEERFALIIRITKIVELGTLAVTSRVLQLLVTANVPTLPILSIDNVGDTFLRNVCSYKSHTS